MTEAAPPKDLDPQLEVLQGLCHAFGSSDDLFGVATSAVRWIHAAVGDEASVRISLVDLAGRLRTVAEGGTVARVGRKSSTRRRQAFESRTPMLLDREPGAALAIMPLMCRNESVGVLEVVASRRLIAEWEATLDAVASQLAIAVWNLRDREGLGRQVKSLTSAPDLVRELVGAQTFEVATQAALKLSFRLLKTPVAGWVRDGEQLLRFIGVRGAGTKQRERLRMMLPSLSPWETSGPAERARVTDRFGEAMGVSGVAVIDGRDAVILAGRPPEPAAAFLGVVGSLFQEALRHLATVARAERRNEQLDLGIAWTAHEVRAPILAVKAALDHLSTTNRSMAGGELLSRSGQELGYLAGLVDALLRWATGAGPLRRRPIDLVKVVRQAVESCRLECGDGRLKLDASMSLLIRADPMELRTAIANVLRNALAYAPKDTDVSVEVSLSDGVATVSVMDQGPGIPVEERDAIFDPFTRGRSGNGHRDGHGLGLFIARRVVEAHGGSIWAESSRGEGTTFRLQLPLGGNGARPRNNRVTDRLPTDGGETRARSHR